MLQLTYSPKVDLSLTRSCLRTRSSESTSMSATPQLSGPHCQKLAQKPHLGRLLICGSPCTIEDGLSFPHAAPCKHSATHVPVLIASSYRAAQVNDASCSIWSSPLAQGIHYVFRGICQAPGFPFNWRGKHKKTWHLLT